MAAKLVRMPDGQNVQTIFISSTSELTTHLLKFWSSARGNPMVAFETEWDCSNNSSSSNHTANTRIALLSLCNLDNTCLIINLQKLSTIPSELTKFLAVKDIKFVGVNILKELTKLKEDYGIEIRNAIELSEIVTSCWRDDNTDKFVHMSGSYEKWDTYTLYVPNGRFSKTLLSSPFADISLCHIYVWG